MLIRSIEDNQILVQNQQGEEVVLKEDEFLASLGLDGIIRISVDEYKNIDTSLEYFAHFNLENTGHIVGDTYLLTKIIRNGKYSISTGDQVLPLLNTENCYVGKCVDVKNYLKYEELDESYFKYSMSNIKNVDDLKQIIIQRYSKSMPALSNEEIINLGVGYTLLKIVK